MATSKTILSPSNQLRFDAEKHQYWVGKKRIPGVSEILQKIGLVKDYKGVDAFYRDRGIATHKAIELHLKGVLDQSSLDPAVQPCFAAFLAYAKEHSLCKIVALEKPLVDIAETFAGTPDLITEEFIYDWKCSKSHDKVAELQGQAYNQLASVSYGTKGIDMMNFRFIVVELHDDGTYAEFDYGKGWNQWSSVMDLYRWRTGKNEE